MKARTNIPLRVAAVSAAASVVGALASLPAAADEHSSSVSAGGVDVVNTETVQVYTDAVGTIETQRIYEQLALTGKGSVDLRNPIETDGLRNLEGFGGFDVEGGEQVTSMTVDGEEHLRTVSDYDGKLPLEVRVQYLLDGKPVEPGDVVGEDGRLEVRYSVKNVTAVEQEVSFDDGKGGTVTKTVEVPIPMVGSLTTVAPSSFTDVRSSEANMAGDGKGGTKMSFTMTLFPPIGSDTAEFGYSADITDGVVPRASISALPVNPLESPSFKSAGESYKGGADTGAQLADGATQIDENLLKLRDGAGELLAGLIKLRDGAVKLDAGLSGVAAPGASRLADGAGELRDGVVKIDDGAGRLADGAGRLRDGAGRLNDGARRLDDGAGQLAGGGRQLADGTRKLAAGTRKLDTGAQKLSAGAGELSAGLGEAGAKAPLLIGGLEQVQEGLGLVDDGLRRLSDGVGEVRDNPRYQALLKGLEDLVSGVGSVDKAGSLTWGVEQVRTGLQTKAVPGLKLMSDGVVASNVQLKCAVTVLKDVRNGTVATNPVRAGTTDDCYKSTNNPSGTVPPLVALSAVDPADGLSPAEYQTLTVGSLVTQLEAALPRLYDLDPDNNVDPDTGAPTASLYEGLQAVLLGLDNNSASAPGAIQALSAVECGLDNTSLGFKEDDVRVCDAVRPGKPGLRQGLEQVAEGVPTLVETIITTVQGAIGTDADVPADETLRGGVNGLQAGVGELQAGGSALLEGLAKLVDGAGRLDAGAGRLADGTGELDGGARELRSGAGRLADGADRLADGTGRLADGSGELSDGAGRLADGAGELADGTGRAADGAGQVADGAGELSDGLGDAADGSGKIADGLGKAAAGAPKLRDGAQRLSDEGTSKLVEAGKSTAQNYGEMYAVIEAGAERAQADKMVYGAPEGAFGLAAYSYEIKGEDGEGGRNVARGLGGMAVLAAGAGAFALRRRLV